MNIVLIGPPGSGKGTQAELLGKELGVPVLNVGDLLFFRSQEEDAVGRKIKELQETGGMVDDKTTIKIVEEHIRGSYYKKGFVLDGFPRRLTQAKVLKIKLDRVIYLRVGDDVNMKRLLKRAKEEGRKDDKPEIIKKRLKLYHQETEPVLDYYRKQGILEEVDGEQPIEVIFEDIFSRLKNSVTNDSY